MKYPPILIVVLQRFFQQQMGNSKQPLLTKVCRSIETPRSLELSDVNDELFMEEKDGKLVYQHKATILHKGNNSIKHKWIFFPLNNFDMTLNIGLSASSGHFTALASHGTDYILYDDDHKQFLNSSYAEQMMAEQG